MTTAWVVGATGLLGSALCDTIRARGGWNLLPTRSLPWDDNKALAAAARAAADQLALAAATAGSGWSVIWVGGSGVTSTPKQQLDNELGQLSLVLDAIAPHLSATGPGTLFYASSAGGVYGGSSAPPFSELTEPRPISPYGDFKLEAEAIVERFARKNGVRSLIGRIANLYGPGQKLSKMQGLISHIARAQYSPAPASIFVPLDTVRDYIYVSDCSALILDCLDQLATAEGTPHVTKVLASGQGVTIGELLGHFHALAKARPHIMLGQSAASSLQAVDLRLTSVVWPELDRRPLTPLPVGIHATMQSVLRGLVA